MISKKMPKLKIGDLEAKIPIIQGGMGVSISLSNLASAVANEGGIGVISAAGAGMLDSDFKTNFKNVNRSALRKEIQKARKMTKGIIGVNLMVALSDFDALTEIAIDEGADLVFLGAGLPLKHFENLLAFNKKGSHKTKIVPIVSSGRAAKIIFHYWEKNYNDVPDAVVVEGPLAGGHLGFKKEQIKDVNYKLEKLLLDVIEEIKYYEIKFKKKIPVIAAGGIFTGADIYKFIQLGAAGVQMATRFVATDECDAYKEFKDAYIDCKEEDIIIIESPVGLPGRAIRNKFLDEVSAGHKKPFTCPWKCLKTCDYKTSSYCIVLALTNAKTGNLKDGFTFAGANAYRVKEIISVKELMKILQQEYSIFASSCP